MLEVIGKKYYDFRADLMIRNDEGLTKTYNRFHDPEETSPGILQLRELHAAMDRAVLDAYGWADIPTDCEFLLDYEDEDEEEDTGRKRKKKKPWRYRWPDDSRDEVLARLLALNQERYEEEVAAGLHGSKNGKKRAPKKATKIAPAKREGKRVATPGSVASERTQAQIEFTSERHLPAAARVAAVNPLAYATALVVALLSEAGGSLSARRLHDAFVLGTTPNLLAQFAPPESKKLAEAWCKRWNEKATPDLLPRALLQLGSQNLNIDDSSGERRFELLDGPRQNVPEEIAFDAWLALTVVESLGDVPKQIPASKPINEELETLSFA